MLGLTMLSTDTACLALSTASTTEEGERLGRALVEEQLAACVTVVPEARSIYRWEGAIESGARRCC